MAEQGALTEDIGKAELVLFDSFNDMDMVISAKREHPSIPFVHRINGPISAYRGGGEHVDRLIHALTRNIADGVVFQSRYSMERNVGLGIQRPAQCAVIHNAARPMFSPTDRPVIRGERIKLIATSWSPNINKGFEIYQFLDRVLDFSRYSFTFVGSSPCQFNNITTVPPQEAGSLLEYLRGHDIYLTASKNESCSNAVLEALAVGLPVVALDSGGTPELVGSAGSYFKGIDDVIGSIEKVADTIGECRGEIRDRKISDACGEYLAFFGEVLRSVRSPKVLTFAGLMEIRYWMAYRKFLLGVDKLNRIREQFT